MRGAAWRRRGACVILAVAILFVLAAVPSRVAAAPSDEWRSPFLLQPGLGLSDQYGYAPLFTRHVPAFDNAGRAYIRSRTSNAGHTSYVHSIVDGRWTELDFRDALRAAYLTFAATVGAGGQRSDKIVFDRQDRAYNPLTIRLKDGSVRNVLMVSWDLCRSWKVFELPEGEFTVEHRVGHNEIDGPPFLAVWRPSGFNPAPNSQRNSLWVTKPRLEGEELVIPPLVPVTRECLGLHKDSGGGSFAVTQGGKTTFVWAEATPPGVSLGGTPQYVATYDHDTGEVSEPIRLASTRPANDTHNKPSLCSDSRGYLHFVAGPHGTPAVYRRSLEPNDALAGWTEPELVLTDGHIDPARPDTPTGRQTYNAFVCDSADTLHLVSRQWRRGVDEYHEGREYGALIHQSRPSGGVWSAPTVIVVAAEAGYGLYYHKLAVDQRDRLFLSLSYSGGTERDRHRAHATDMQKLGRSAPQLGRYRRRMLLLSEDGGASWRFARDTDLAAPGQRLAAPTEPSWAAITPGPEPAPLKWAWMRPLPQGNQVAAIDFANKRVGWAVGTYGTILRTTDGGATWRRQASGTTAGLFGVSAASGKIAWAVGHGGAVLRTTDAGRTWRRQTSRTTRSLFAVHALSDRVACAVGHRGVVRVTTDAGKTWRIRSTGTVQPLFAVTFVGKRGWAAGGDGRIVRTNDSGETWSRQARRVSSTLFTISFFDEACGVAAGNGGALLYTRDGGRTWGTAARGPSALRSATMTSRAAVMAVGDNGLLLRSRDGGRTWSRHRLPLPGVVGAVASKGGRAWAGGVGGVIPRSADNGRTWTSVAPGLTVPLNAAATSGARSWSAGAGGWLAMSPDGGSSWRRQKTGTTADLRAITVRGQEGWTVGGSGVVMKSVDGGISWKRASSPGPSRLTAVASPGLGQAWVAGDAGGLFSSSDGGVTWTVHEATNEDLKCVASLGSYAWAGGGVSLGDRQALLFRTRNAGRDWEEVSVPVWGFLTGLHFLDPLRGWAVAVDWGRDGDARFGAVLATRDGGKTWVVQARVQEALTAVHMADAMTGWAFGEGGTALQTADGGASWHRRPVRTDSDLRAASAPAPGQSLVVGDGGAVLLGRP